MIGASGPCRASLLSGCSRMLSSSSCPAASTAWSCQPAGIKVLQLRQLLSRAQLSRCTSQHARSQLLPPAAAVQQGTAAHVRQAATDASRSDTVTTQVQQRRQPQQQQRKSDGSRIKQQTLDYTLLAACCHELSGSWVPSKVEEVVQPDKFTLSLRLRTPLAQGWLHLSWHPTAARVAMGQPPYRGDVSEAFSFAAQASAQLKGLVLLSARLPAPWERVVQLDFGARPGEAPSKSVFCEVMAKYSNVVVTSGDGSVLHCAYQVGGAMSSLRQVQAGRQYQLPPPVNGIPPSPQEPMDTWRDNITRAAALAAAEQAAAPSRKAAAAAASSTAAAPSPRETVLAGATRAYMGVSPALVEELCATAGISPAASPDSLSPEAWQAFYAAWQAWLGRLHSGNFAPSSCAATGKFSVIGSYSQPHDSAHDMVEGYYRSLQAGEVYAGLHTRLCTAVKQALKKARGRVKAFEQQLQAADEVAAVQKQADIIVANMYRLQPNASQLEAEDWDTGKPVVIALDPLKSPMEQAEGLFKRARKLRRAVDAVQPLLEAAQQEAEYLETVELELAQMPPGGSEQQLAALREVQDELVESKIIKPPPEAALSAKAAAKGRKAQKQQHKAAAARAGGSSKAGLNSSLAAAAAVAAGGAGLRQYESPGGFTVLVGRNNKQNDVLSHQVAKPGDIWMHVRGMPGSHTVIRVDAGREPDQGDLQYAADLAAWFSKARDAGKADVIVARAEHLKKFKGAKPGQVLVTKEESNIVARPDNSAAAQAASVSGSRDE